MRIEVPHQITLHSFWYNSYDEYIAICWLCTVHHTALKAMQLREGDMHACICSGCADNSNDSNAQHSSTGLDINLAMKVIRIYWRVSVRLLDVFANMVVLLTGACKVCSMQIAKTRALTSAQLRLCSTVAATYQFDRYARRHKSIRCHLEERSTHSLCCATETNCCCPSSGDLPTVCASHMGGQGQ